MLANKIRTKLLLDINKDLTNNNKKNIVLINSYNPKDIQKNYLKDIDTIKLKSNLYHNSSKNSFLSTSFNYLETSDTTENDSFSKKEKSKKEFDFVNKIKSRKKSSFFLEKKMIISQKKLNIKKNLNEHKKLIKKNSFNLNNEYDQNYYIKKLRNYSKTLILSKKRKVSLGYDTITKKLFKLFKSEIKFYESKTHSSFLNKYNFFNELNNEINFEEVKNAFNKVNFVLNEKNEIEIENVLRHSFKEENKYNKEIFNSSKNDNDSNSNSIIQLHKIRPAHHHHSTHHKNVYVNKINWE